MKTAANLLRAKEYRMSKPSGSSRYLKQFPWGDSSRAPLSLFFISIVCSPVVQINSAFTTACTYREHMFIFQHSSSTVCACVRRSPILFPFPHSLVYNVHWVLHFSKRTSPGKATLPKQGCADVRDSSGSRANAYCRWWRIWYSFRPSIEECGANKCPQ